jgi:membrane fusion protein (multidrug efflux system)
MSTNQTIALPNAPAPDAPATQASAPAPAPEPAAAAPAPEHHKKHPKKKSAGLRVLNVALVLAVLGALGWYAWGYWGTPKDEYTNDAQVESFIVPINTRVGGYVKTMGFTEHQAVKKGDTLVTIDDRELRLQLAQANAAYLDALAAKGVTEASVHTVSNNTGVAEANIAELDARLETARKNERRYANLLRDEAVTRQQYEQVKAEYDAMRARRQALSGQRQSTELSTAEVRSRLRGNEANILRTKAALDFAKLNLSYTVIRAPYDGTVGRRTLQEGQLVQPGQALVSFVRADQQWVTANYRETQISRLHVGQKVRLTVDALQGQAFEGTVTAISEATGARYSAVPTDNSTGNFVKVQQRIPVRIEFTAANTPESLRKLRAGMNVEVEAQL